MNDHLNCSQMLATLSDYVDGAAARELCAEIERHLQECENCRVVVNTLNKTVEIVHQANEDPQLPEDVHHRLFACLQLNIPNPDKKPL